MSKDVPFQLVINGQAGSGKSYLFKLIKEGLEIKKNKICKSIGLTGTASFYIDGNTLHSIFKLFENPITKKLQSNIDRLTNTGMKIVMTDVFCIDE